MLRIRLSRTGKKKQPSYRVVVANSESKRDGRIVERIGNYYPLMKPSEYNIEEARALYWLSVGAQPSDTVARLLKKQGTYDRLARLREGESLEALVAEYEGVPLVEDEVVEEVEEVVEETEAAADQDENASFFDKVKGAVAGVVDSVQDAAEDAGETLEEVYDDVKDAITGEEEE